MSTEESGWFKSSHSGPDGDSCVEVSTSRPEAVWVRDSKDPRGPRLSVSPTAWRAFVSRAAG
ncbi:DUF397 domain-containing protein [Streptomyces calidiresistens]|uniref:DUF397 domain-containing protein n=1 Tax=Streptomyces calidiresistens TaxID=1485586 RepID=A0A7W3T3D5_9ACTN|nr:DUF397 domain-containing protein [Streptomyces calidiresistens]MBB0230194.1 DUF397 domain-containing protein [Streptomyces calidiresistens]